ncbi:MAG TPA: cell wall hydrolase, partial [Xanthobacteraceae bacterium]|nr:cell wall hydrolase [Xanthobacteraceae bacterium]
LSLELHPQVLGEELDAEGAVPDTSILSATIDPDPAVRNSRIFFGHNAISPALGAIEPWQSGEEPILMPEQGSRDSEIKRSAFGDGNEPETKSLSLDAGVTIAGKGEVTGEGRRPKSPAERLELNAASRAKAEKCLANAVYFEARGESVRGQVAVAQVVMNRVFSGYYPSDVCGVVYQNAHRHLACQFTFACDRIPDRITEPDAWQRANAIANAALDGKVWLNSVGKATHYHAYWVRPWWVRTMHKLDRIGVHTFYRPRRWGDGADAPVWGSARSTAETTAKL